MNAALLNELRKLQKDFLGLENMSDGAVRLMGCGSFPQFVKTLRAELDPPRFCGFCQYNPILDLCPSMNNRWWLRQNEFKKRQVLIVPRRHLTNVLEMTTEDDMECGGLYRFAMKKLGLKGGMRNERFGDPRLNAGTMAHYHVNLVTPESMYTEHREAVSKNAKDRIGNYERLLKHWNELVQWGGLQRLLSPEGLAAIPI